MVPQRLDLGVVVVVAYAYDGHFAVSDDFDDFCGRDGGLGFGVWGLG